MTLDLSSAKRDHSMQTFFDLMNLINKISTSAFMLPFTVAAELKHNRQKYLTSSPFPIKPKILDTIQKIYYYYSGAIYNIQT